MQIRTSTKQIAVVLFSLFVVFPAGSLLLVFILLSVGSRFMPDPPKESII